MPTSNNSLNKNLYDLLTSISDEVVSRASSGKEVPVPEEADIFQFHFHKDNVDYGTVTVSIDGKNQLIVYSNNKLAGSAQSSDEEEDSWLKFLKKLKRFALKRQLSFKVSNMDKLGNDMKLREYNKKLDESASHRDLLEGYYGNKHTSWSDSGPKTIKIMIKHNKSINEGDARYRHISQIFLETELGERILVPTIKPTVARAFARHIAEGGQYNDERWAHIKQLSEEVNTYAQFIRATRSAQLNEDALSLVDEARNQYISTKQTIQKLGGTRGYNRYFNNWTQPITEDDDSHYLSEIFKQTTLDPRIESALPLLARFSKKSNHMEEALQFESWADDLINDITEGLAPETQAQQSEIIELLSKDSKPLPVGPDGINAIARIKDIIKDQELNQRLRNASYQDADRDARPIIIGWMEEQPGKEYAHVLTDIAAAPSDDKLVKQKVPADNKNADSDSVNKKDELEQTAPANSLSSLPSPTGLDNFDDMQLDQDDLPLPSDEEIQADNDQELEDELDGESPELKEQIGRLKSLSGMHPKK